MLRATLFILLLFSFWLLPVLAQESGGLLAEEKIELSASDLQKLLSLSITQERRLAELDQNLREAKARTSDLKRQLTQAQNQQQKLTTSLQTAERKSQALEVALEKSQESLKGISSNLLKEQLTWGLIGAGAGGIIVAGIFTGLALGGVF